ncbi:hypothetical protein [Psychromarinibacter halotolerans]|uniref:DUF3311 domain-containing protein n=1 Tax=Psychromarinibacter halotolerans TaxID=1775175 RepID=A0ABV7GUS8_9RHOB|nr:hypothetical protein [Psychromarinibacter halotolerans]MDF0596152.1 hypothetical protein [Psychromarinibacter halotolerans]
MTRRPVFLERRSYRRRRVMDGARLLPVIGAFLLLMPLVWGVTPGRLLGTAGSGIYLFAVWAGLIVVALVFSRILLRPDEERPPKDRDE